MTRHESVFRRTLWAFAAVALIATPVLADHHEEKTETAAAGEAAGAEDARMKAWMEAATPGEAHQRFAARAGEWKMTVKMFMDPAADPMVTQATATREMILGGRVLREKLSSDFMGMPFEGLGMTGFDNVTGKVWSSWNDNMSTGMRMLDGSYDPETHVVNFTGDYIDPLTKEAVPIRAVASYSDADTEKYEEFETKDGKEVKTMEIVAERVKQ